MFTHKSFFKSSILFLLLNFLIFFDTHASSNEEVREIENAIDNPSQSKNRTIGSWWMWATGSGLIVLFIFAFSKEEEGISFNK